MGSWSVIVIVVSAGVLTPVLVGLLHKAGRTPVAPDHDGWIQVGPTVGTLILGVLGLLLSLLFAFTIPFIAFNDGGSGEVGEVQSLASSPLSAVFIVGMSALFALFVFGTAVAFRVSCRFNDHVLRYQGVFRRFDVDLRDIIEARDDPLLSLTVRTRNHGRLPLLKHLRGFAQLLDRLRERGIPVDPQLYKAS